MRGTRVIVPYSCAAKPVGIKNDAETNKASDDLLESILAGDDEPPLRASR